MVLMNDLCGVEMLRNPYGFVVVGDWSPRVSRLRRDTLGCAAESRRAGIRRAADAADSPFRIPNSAFPAPNSPYLPPRKLRISRTAVAAEGPTVASRRRSAVRRSRQEGTASENSLFRPARVTHPDSPPRHSTC